MRNVLMNIIIKGMDTDQGYQHSFLSSANICLCECKSVDKDNNEGDKKETKKQWKRNKTKLLYSTFFLYLISV